MARGLVDIFPMTLWAPCLPSDVAAGGTRHGGGGHTVSTAKPSWRVLVAHDHGVAAVWEIAARVLPTAKIVVLTAADTGTSLFTALRAGVSGYLLKTMNLGRLPDALHGAAYARSGPCRTCTYEHTVAERSNHHDRSSVSDGSRPCTIIGRSLVSPGGTSSGGFGRDDSRRAERE